jgi:branched-chain amino acid transport system permease protein
MQLFLFQILNGLQLSMLIFLLAAGLTLIFGLMNILNLAHGAFFTLGAYGGLLASSASGSFWAALIVGPMLPFVLGALLQYFVLQPLVDRGRSTHLDLALMTFGLLFATAGAVELLYGSAFYSIAMPPVLSGHISLLGFSYPAYRLFIMAAGLVVALSLKLVVNRTLIGARYQRQSAVRDRLRRRRRARGVGRRDRRTDHERLLADGDRHCRNNVCRRRRGRVRQSQGFLLRFLNRWHD